MQYELAMFVQKKVIEMKDLEGFSEELIAEIKRILNQ